jgi:hypothetical protein
VALVTTTNNQQPTTTTHKKPKVRDGLVPLIAELKARGTPPDAAWLHGREYDVDAQAALCKAVAVDIGFDLERGRLDVSVHPFTGGTHPSDVRMTTRFKAGDLTEGLTGAIHEVWWWCGVGWCVWCVAVWGICCVRVCGCVVLPFVCCRRRRRATELT